MKACEIFSSKDYLPKLMKTFWTRDVFCLRNNSRPDCQNGGTKTAGSPTVDDTAHNPLLHGLELGKTRRPSQAETVTASSARKKSRSNGRGTDPEHEEMKTQSLCIFKKI